MGEVFGRGERRESQILTDLVTGSRRSPLPNVRISVSCRVV